MPRSWVLLLGPWIPGQYIFLSLGFHILPFLLLGLHFQHHPQSFTTGPQVPTPWILALGSTGKLQASHVDPTWSSC